jgi:tellurite methyltransferase
VSDAARRDIDPPSAFFCEHASRLSTTASIGPTLDLACGRGRHTIAAADLGLSVLGIDRDPERLRERLESRSGEEIRSTGSIEIMRADLEAPLLPDLEPASFGAVLVFRYLHRPLFAWIESLVAPGGILLYETFTRDQMELGWGPKREEYLLGPRELPSLLFELVVEVYEEGASNDASPARTGRLLASRPR